MKRMILIAVIGVHLAGCAPHPHIIPADEFGDSYSSARVNIYSAKTRGEASAKADAYCMNIGKYADFSATNDESVKTLAPALYGKALFMGESYESRYGATRKDYRVSFTCNITEGHYSPDPAIVASIKQYDEAISDRARAAAQELGEQLNARIREMKRHPTKNLHSSTVDMGGYTQTISQIGDKVCVGITGSSSSTVDCY